MENKNIDISQLLSARKYDPGKTVLQEQVIFKIQDKPIGAIESYCVISGNAKVGKSTFLTSLIASAFVPSFSDVFTMKLYPLPERPKVCFFDTESSTYDFYRVIDRIKKFAYRENIPENLDAFNTREDQPATIRKMIVSYLEANKDCSILVIDGFLDLCMNYNDEVETRLLTNWFKKITKEYQILLIGVLHLSKGAGQTIGHLGSNTDRWAQSTLLVEKDETTRQIVLKPKFLRSADNFDPIALQNINGNWQQVFYQHDAPGPETGKKKAPK